MKHFVYCRKSTDTEDKQVMSLDGQKREMLELAQRSGIEVVGVFEESQSALHVGRPVFARMLARIQKGEAQGILCWKLDRLARNMVEGGQVIDMLQRSVICQIKTPFNNYLPSDNVLPMAVEFGMSNQYSRDLSQNVKRGNRQALEQGRWPGRAFFGYTNNKGLGTISVDQDKALYIKQAFTMYATGMYSYQQIADQLHADGLRTKTGKKVHKSAIERWLRETFYYGLMYREGKYYQGVHEPIISKSLFDKVQEVRSQTGKPRRQKHTHAHLGLFKCASCGCAITAQKQRGKHTYYHCTNGKGICEQTYVKESELDEQIMLYFDQIDFDEQLVEVMYRAALEKIGLDNSHNEQVVANLEKELHNLTERKNRLLDVYLSGNLDQDEYEEKLQDIKKEILSTRQQVENQKNQPDPRTTIERTKEVFLASNRAKKEYMEMKSEQKRTTTFKLLLNGLLDGRKVLSLQYKSPYDVLAGTPVNADFSTLWAIRDLNP